MLRFVHLGGMDDGCGASEYGTSEYGARGKYGLSGMNALDMVVLASMFAAVVGGYRLGFLARGLSWAGMMLGISVASRTLPSVVRAFQDSESQVRLLVAAGFLLGTAMVGQGIGLALGSMLHKTLPAGMGVRQGDRAGGAVLGALGVVVMVWLMTPALADAPGWPSRLARTSSVIAAINDLAPDPPNTVQALRRLVGEGNFPQVFPGLEKSPDVGTPPNTTLSAAVVNKVTASTVKITGNACGRIQEGSGFAVGRETVVTNAHVVAGDRSVRVQIDSGKALDATVIAFEPNRDLAVLRVPGLDMQPLTLGNAEIDATGAVFGHPGGGPLRIAPAAVRQRVTAIGRDIYDQRSTRRDVLILASSLRPGDSGAALVNEDGIVIGVAFAIAPDQPDTSYALSDDELRPVLSRATGSQATDTGRCLPH